MTNIDHSNCAHERTSKARAKCRRALANGSSEAPKASTKTLDFRGSGGVTSQTPRDADRACMVCGVERFEARGRDLVSGTFLYVGEKCMYMIARDPDAQGWDAKERQWFDLDLTK